MTPHVSEVSMDSALLRRPTALVPIAMSLAALTIAIGYALFFGTARQADEGTAAGVAALFPVWWFNW